MLYASPGDKIGRKISGEDAGRYCSSTGQNIALLEVASSDIAHL
jgi:hypothetical protein